MDLLTEADELLGDSESLCHVKKSKYCINMHGGIGWRDEKMYVKCTRCAPGFSEAFKYMDE